ncbi:MAG: DNA polymerase III subunit gamma/tau [Legionella sp.]|nr:DNA polymerase III subunit gamma/tau [Legionella sp.]
MSYLALARKWRPRTFSQLVGQEHINKALINALNQQRLHHAYLFTGTRGVGKTSVARILAKALNCEQGISSEPCLQCDACTAIEQGRFIDLIEIDGASKTRVEDTRELLDNVQYATTNGRFKIYLIDEVHMLSQHSFNALLKTLEEPPAHVKFILATTDPQKLPVTVLSRCLQFNLKHLPADIISQHLQIILKDEQLEYEMEALHLLAKAAHGSMRDALSLLDHAITYANKTVYTQEVKQILGYTQQDYAIQLLQALAAENPILLLELTQQIEAEGGHFNYVLDELQTYLHQLTVYLSIGDNNALISPSAQVKALAQQLCAEDVQLFYQIAIKSREDIQLAPTLSIGFSMTLLRMLTFRPAPQVKSQAMASQTNEQAPTSSAHLSEFSEMPKNDAAVVSISAPVPQAIQPPATHSLSMPPATIDITSDNWSSIITSLKLSGLALTAVENSEFISKEGRNVTLGLAKGFQSLFTPSTTMRIEAALSLYYQSPIKLFLSTKNSQTTTPAQQKDQRTQDKLQKAEEALASDPVFQQIKQDFSAELVKNSIVSLKDEL